MILLAGNNQTIQRFRVIQGGRSGVGNGPEEGWKKEAPIVEEPKPDPLAQTRKKNRLMLATEYNYSHPMPMRRGWAPYPEAEARCRIESISQQADELKRDLESRNDENQIDLAYNASRLARKLGSGASAREREYAAQKLAFFASDPEIYGNEPAAAALSGLMRGASRGIVEAKDALRSLGLDADSILRETGRRLAFSMGAAARRIIRIYSRRVDVALRKLENAMQLEL